MTTIEYEGSEQQRARTLIARLELVSHGTVAKIGGDPGGGDGDGPLFPSGGIGHLDDLEVDHPLKSHAHFHARLSACRTEPQYGTLADDVQVVLERWHRAKRPPRDSTAWRALVAKDNRRASDVAAEWGISKSYVHQLRQQLKREAA